MSKIIGNNNKYIILFLVLSISLKLYSFSGIYISPKFSFYPYTPEYKIESESYEYSLGYGLSLGYDFSRFMKAAPFRVDVEYLANISLNQIDFRTDYVLLNGYYDIYFFDINKLMTHNLKDNKSTLLFSAYIGLNLGLSVLSELQYEWYEKNTLVSVQSMVYRRSVIGGLNAGFVWHINRYFAIDLGYKFLISPLVRDSHEVLLNVRFTVINN